MRFCTTREDSGPSQIVERFGLAGQQGRRYARRGIGAQMRAFRVQRKDGSRNTFENGFHELTAALEFLHGLLKMRVN